MKIFEVLNSQACRAIDAYIDAEIARLKIFDEIVERAKKDGATQIITTGRNAVLHGFAFPEKPENYTIVPSTDLGELSFPVYRPNDVDLSMVSRTVLQIENVPPLTVTADGTCIMTTASRKDGRYYVSISAEAGIDNIPGFLEENHSGMRQERRVSRPWG